MSAITFIRDYVQDPDKIVSIPNFIFSGCKDLVWHICSFEWLHNLTYVTLLKPTTIDNSTFSLFETGLQNKPNTLDVSNNLLNTFIESWLAEPLATNLKPEQISFLTNIFYGFFNGISSTFHFSIITILIIHVILHEDKKRAFKITTATCFGDISFIAAILFGFRGIIIRWLSLEPLTLIGGFFIQAFFAALIIKDNDQIRAFNRRFAREFFKCGKLSYNPRLMPSLVLFSWCEQTQIFQTTGVFGLQPSATMLEMWGLLSYQTDTFFVRELQILTYLIAFAMARLLFIWCFLSIVEGILYKKGIGSDISFVRSIPSRLENFRKSLMAIDLRKTLSKQNIKDSLVIVWFFCLTNVKNLLSFLAFWLIPKSLMKKISLGSSSPTWLSEILKSDSSKGIYTSLDEVSTSQKPWTNNLKTNSSGQSSPQEFQSLSLRYQGLLKDPLAIAAVTCCLLYFPNYSINYFVTKPFGFFPEESRFENTLIAPWDIPSKAFSVDGPHYPYNFEGNKYSVFASLFDKGHYGGYFPKTEEDIRYPSFRIWETRRSRVPQKALITKNDPSIYKGDTSLVLEAESNKPDLGRVIFPKNLKESTGNITNTPRISSPYNSSLTYSPRATTNFVEDIYNSSNMKSKISTPKANKSNTSLAKGISLPFSSDSQSKTSKDTKDKDTIKLSSWVNNLSKKTDLLSARLEKWDYLIEQSKTRKAYKKLFGRFDVFKDDIFPDEKRLTPFSQGRAGGLTNTLSQKRKSKVLADTIKRVLDEDISIKQVKEKDAKLLKKIQRGEYDLDMEEMDGAIDLFLQPTKKHTTVVGPSLFLRPRMISCFNFDLKTPFNCSKEYIDDVDISRYTNHDRKKRRKYLKKEDKILRNQHERIQLNEFRHVYRLGKQRITRVRDKGLRRERHLDYIKDKVLKDTKYPEYVRSKLLSRYPYIHTLKGKRNQALNYKPPFCLPEAIENTPNVLSETRKDESMEKAVKSCITRPFAPFANDNSFLNLDSKNPYSKNPYSNPLTDQSCEEDNLFDQETPYSAGYPRNKQNPKALQDFDFEFVFRTQLGEAIDFEKEEIRARTTLNPYGHFLLNRRIDSFLDRVKSNQFQKKDETGSKHPLENTGLNMWSNYMKDGDLFKRRLMLSKYADSLDLLRPRASHSFIDRIYNHQFKGTLSTARRLFSLNVQYDKPLISSINYKPAISHEGLSDLFETSNLSPRESDIAQSKTPLNESQSKQINQILDPKDQKLITDQTTITKNSNGKQDFDMKLLDSTPFYAVWDPQLHKLVLSFRYLDYKNTTLSATLPKAQNSITDNKQKHVIQFTNWPLKQPYSEKSEYVLSKLYYKSRNLDPEAPRQNEESEKARPVSVPKRTNYYGKLDEFLIDKQMNFGAELTGDTFFPPTKAQLSQQFLDLQAHDKKTFLFHIPWDISGEGNQYFSKKDKGKNVSRLPIKTNTTAPTSVDVKKPDLSWKDPRVPFNYLFKVLPPNQGGFIWPGD